MQANFWKSLELLGAGGSALCDWRLLLEEDLDQCAAFLRPTARVADTIVCPTSRQQRLSLMPDGAHDFVALSDDTWDTPIPVSASEAKIYEPRWNEIAKALGEILQFTPGTWDNDGMLRQIGIVHGSGGVVTPVLLFLPSGQLGDYQALFRDLARREKSTVLLPTNRWLNRELEDLRQRCGHQFVVLFDHLRELASSPQTSTNLPAIPNSIKSARGKTKALIHTGNGLTWEKITIELAGNQSIRIRAPGQDKIHSFSKRSKLSKHHPLGILIQIGSKGYWENPPTYAAEYERVSKAFQRFRALLRELIPLAEEPFVDCQGRHTPRFMVKIQRKDSCDSCSR
jgi:hypothetical protein